MKVRYWMTRDPVTIDSDASIADAARVMKERRFRRLPVMENGRLAGLVTYRNILEAQPSAASTLSVHEARYLVAKLKVRDVMRKNIITLSPDDDVLTAMMEGHRKGLGAYPVVEADGRLVGIVTAADLFNLIVHILGAADRDDFIYLSEEAGHFEAPGYIGRIAAILSGHDVALLSFLSLPRRETADKGVVILKVSRGRRVTAVGALTAEGFQIIN
ncbi:MAG: CBS domain-containing protein [Candidatus Adiutrix sp.]|jgi:acetoin utilization protein AcuB|nr:CBS domain-containing protein [Candidatus Adiutrix sp.]